MSNNIPGFQASNPTNIGNVLVSDINGNLSIGNGTQSVFVSCGAGHNFVFGASALTAPNGNTAIDVSGNVFGNSISGNPGTVPTVTLGAGITGSVSIVDANPSCMGLRVQLVVGGAGAVVGKLFTVNFATALPHAPKVVWSASNSASAGIVFSTDGSTYINAATLTASLFEFYLMGTTLVTGTYIWDFFIIG